MKILCDVCNKDEASVFCTADEAALCHGCDHRVHHANKLASKHQRLSLQRPSPKQYPLCDVCLERRAFVFCQQDRAILCKECDLPIHSANEHTKKHNRFLLTGIKLSAAATLYSSPPSNSVLTCSSGSTSNSKSQPSVNNSVLVSSDVPNPPLMAKTSPSTASTSNNFKAGGSLLTIEGAGSISASSISEYLIDTLPGWQVEDFLDSSFAPFGFRKSDGMLPQPDADIERNLGSFSTENMGIWVPQAPSPLYSSLQMDQQIGQREAKDATVIKANKSRLRDDNLVVPQISPSSKRSRFLW